MLPFTPAERDAPPTRARRKAILARAPLTAPLAARDIDKLLTASWLATCPGGTVLFSRDDPPQRVFLIGSVTVKMRVRAGGLADGAHEPSMYSVAGEPQASHAIARALLCSPTSKADYWALATHAEAAWLLGDSEAACVHLRASAATPQGSLLPSRRARSLFAPNRPAPAPRCDVAAWRSLGLPTQVLGSASRKQGSSSFLKKRTKKLLSVPGNIRFPR